MDEGITPLHDRDFLPMPNASSKYRQTDIKENKREEIVLKSHYRRYQSLRMTVGLKNQQSKFEEMWI